MLQVILSDIPCKPLVQTVDLWEITNKSFKHNQRQSRTTQVSDYQLIVFDKAILTHSAIGHLSYIQLLSHSQFCVTSRL